MGVNMGAFKAPTGLMKILLLCLVIIDLVLYRCGNEGSPHGLIALEHQWLGITTTCGYCLILLVILLTYLLGDLVSSKMEAIFMFVGCILFLATGSLAIQTFDNRFSGALRDTALAFGSMCIITGIFMLVDALLNVKVILGK